MQLVFVQLFLYERNHKVAGSIRFAGAKENREKVERAEKHCARI